MNRNRLINVLIRHEGLRLKPYCDKTGREFKSPPECGKLTIGIGRNLEDRGITKEEAMFLLTNDIKKVTEDLDRHIPWWRELDDVRQEVLVNMTFNLGIGGLLGFKNMLEALKNRDYNRAADEMLNSRWAEQVGRRARELALAMRNGDYPFEVEEAETVDKLTEWLSNRVWKDLNEGW